MYCVKVSSGRNGIKYKTFSTKAKAEKYLASNGFSRCAKSKDTFTGQSGNMTARIIAL